VYIALLFSSGRAQDVEIPESFTIEEKWNWKLTFVLVLDAVRIAVSEVRSHVPQGLRGMMTEFSL
jgi:virulence-associated protein VagC